MGKSRSTVRFTTANKVYLAAESEDLGMSVDDILNTLVAGLRRNNKSVLRALLSSLRDDNNSTGGL